MLDELHWALGFILIIASLLALFIIGMPVGFAMGTVAIGWLLIGAGPDYVINLVTSYTYNNVTAYTFVCFPLFILMAEVMAHGGISRRLVEVAYKVMGRIPGSLAAVAVIAATIFGAVSGASAIGTITISDMLLPECMKRGYDKSLISGAIAAGGTLSYIIPPSFVLILWGIVADVSVERQFMAGIIPGLMIAAMFIVYIVVKTKRNPDLAPMPPAAPLKEQMVTLGRGWPVAVVIFIILYGVYSGKATVTEVSGIGALAAVVLALAHRELSRRSMLNAFTRTAELFSSFIIIIVGAYLLKHLLEYYIIPERMSSWVINADLSSTYLVIAIMAIFFILGMFIEASAVMLIALPLFLPSLNALDVDLIWLGVIVGVSCMIAELTPPVGFSIFIIQAVGKPHGITFVHVVRGVVPFIVLLIVAIALLIIFPDIATWLPSTME